MQEIKGKTDSYKPSKEMIANIEQQMRQQQSGTYLTTGQLLIEKTGPSVLAELEEKGELDEFVAHLKQQENKITDAKR